MPNNFLELSIDDLTTQSKANNNLSSNLEDSPDFLSQSISDLGVADIPPKEVPKDLPVNAESYDITGLMGRLVPKVAEKPPVPATRKGLVETTSEEDFFAPPEPKYGPKRNMPKGFKEVDMPEHFISKDDERSFVSSLVDNVHRLFTSKAEELAKATFQISLANDMGVRPSDISPDLLDAFKAGYGGSIFGLISQIERETKYPKTPIPEHLNAAQIASSGFGSVAGDILPFMAFSRAGVDPVSQMMAGFAGTQGLRAYYAHKLDKGEVSSPREFVDVLKGVVPETLKGAATGTATGWAGKVAAPLGPMSKVGAEAVAMTTVGSIVEGQFPTIQDFVNSAILLVGIHNIAKAPAVAGKIKTMWVKTGRKPADIIEDAKVDPKVAEVILNDGDIPEDVIAKAQAKVDVAEKIQAELAIKAELAKKETNPEEIVKKELAIKGKKVQEIKSGKKGFFEDPFGNQAEIDIITEASVKKGLSEFKKARRSDPIIMTKEEAKKRGLYESDEPVETGIDMLEQSIEDIKPGTINKPAKKVAKKTKKISSPEPITDLDLQTGTPLPKELSTQAHPFRDKNVEHTNTMRKIMQEKVNKVDASPELFTQYLINEVNRYLNGEDVNIEKVRFGLSEVASRADNLRLKFDNPEDFDVWRNTAKAAAQWARGADRLIDKRTGGSNLYMGVDPTQIKRLFKGFHGTSSKYIKPAEIVGKYLEPKSLKRIIEDVLDEVGLKGNDRDKARQQIYKDSYFEHSIKGREGSRSFDKGEVYITNDFESASEYAQWAGEAYDNALSALIDDSIIGKKAKEIYEENREATPYILELNYNQPFKKGDNISETPIQVTGVYDAGGVKLYSGLDAPEATRKIIAGAKALAAYTAKARGMKDWKVGAAADSIREELIRSGVDRSGNIRKKLLDQLGQDGYEIIQKMYLSKGASSLAAQQLKQMRKEVYEGLNKNDKRILDNLILADRMLDIGKYKTASQFKFPEGLSPTESAAYNELFQFTEKITSEKADLLKQKAQAYFEWMKRPLKDMLDAELITQEEYDALASHNYRRLKLVDVFDKRYQTKVGKTKRTVYDSGVESLSHGRETDVFEPSSEVMALEVFNRAYGRILNNAANKTLLDLAREQKDNPFVKIKENKDDHIPSGWDRVFVYDKGERKALYLSPEMTKEWITNNPEMSYKMSQFIRYASGAPVLRTFATGIDWGFALANLPRDIMHTWFAARVFENGKWKLLYNSNTPIFSMQMAADQAAVFSDALLRKGRYSDYIKEGGGMEFLVHQGRIMQRGRHLEGNLDQVQDFLGYFGETTEIMTRLAIRERVIKRRAAERGISYKEASKNKKITQEATFAARDYMDFGQGGGVSKALDNGIPYLNASIQGMRGVLRAFKYNPVQSTYKVAQFAALVTGIYIANNQLHPETMKALKGNASLQNNFIIPIGDSFGFLDEKGQKRYPFIKIPLDQELRFFKAIFEASTDKWLGNEVDVNTLTNTLTNLSPVGISSLPPTASGTLGYMTNKNFWQNEDIWKKTDKSLGWPNSKEEYIPGQTPQGFIDFGAATGMSPERTKYAVQQLVTSGSLWSQLVGAGYEKVFGDLPNDKKEMHLAETLSKMPVINRFFGITNPYSQYAESIKDVREEAVMKRWIENRGLDAKVESYLYEDGKKSDVVDYIKKTSKDLSTEERLQNRFEFQEKIKGLSNRSFWLALKGIPDTDARAELYVKRLNEATPEERNQLRKEEAIIEEAGGIISDEFREAVMSIRYKQ